ncbi:MAG: DedA family protein [Moraxella sp.]|jgi:membrane-associated protein
MWLIDFILHIGDHLQELVKNYGNWIYAILFAIVFCETGLVVLPFLPGDSMLFAAGAIAAVGDMNVFVLMGLLIIAAVLGDFVNFEIGKHFGQRLFANPSSKIFKQSYLQKTHDYYEKYGGRTIIIARFIPIVRTFAPFVGGMGKMNYAQFARYNVMGAVLWVTLFTLLGYFFGQLPFVKQHFSWIMIGIIVVSVVPMVVEIIRHRHDK